MKSNHQNQASKAELISLIIFLLLLNLGAGTFPAFSLQALETGTPTEGTTQSKETIPPTTIITLTEDIATPLVTSTPLSDLTPTPNIKPLPAIFTSGVYNQSELIVRFKSSTRESRINECLQGVDAQVKAGIEILHAMVLEINSGDVGNIYNHILNCAGVLYVEPNFLLQAADTIPNDPNWGNQYGLVNIRAPQGWDMTTGSASVTIAIVDSGVDQGHPDLAGKLVAGYDFVNVDNNPQDDYGHGTHVAGIAAAISNNGAGVTGVSWGARIMPVKVLNASGGGTYANTARGVIWAVDHGAQVINLSLGGTGPSSVLEDAINYAHGKGAIVIAAAGNKGSNFVLYPARSSNVIAVARTNGTNNWESSNYGPEIDLAAPGSMIYSTVIGGYNYNSGTSMAAGYVSGLAAILMGIPGNSSPDLIETQMESTALDIEFGGWDEYTGAGLIQMDAAIQMAWTPTPTPNVDGQNQPFAGSGNIPEFVSSSNTPLPTIILSSTPPLSTETVVLTFETASTNHELGTITSTPIKEEFEVGAQGDENSSNTYTLPCIGTLFILSGAIWVWFLIRKRNFS